MFWERLEEFGEAIALVDERESWSYARLDKAVKQGARALQRPGRKLIFVFARNDVGGLLCYLSCLKSGQLAFLGKPSGDWQAASDQLEKYRPDILLWQGAAQPPMGYEMGRPLFGYHLAERRGEAAIIGKQIGLLLSTSGSMGSPKFVRLSRRNLAIAAAQVAAALGLGPRHRAVVSLPINFVFGLSVVNSHLHAGASLVLTNRSVQDRAFWRLSQQTGVTSLAGIPWTFEMLKSLSFQSDWCPGLTHFSLSGGPIDADLHAWLAGLARDGLAIHAMYGQTESCGRMCVLPSHLFAAKPGSVGLPVQQGKVLCGDDGEVRFCGPNVMLGYALARKDLNDLDSQKEILLTGDTGRLDQDGCLYLTGRTARIEKLFGLRLSLDEIEAVLGTGTVAAAVSGGQNLVLYVERSQPPALEERIMSLVRRLGVPPHCVQVQILPALPRNEAGKILYNRLPR